MWANRTGLAILKTRLPVEVALLPVEVTLLLEEVALLLEEVALLPVEDACMAARRRRLAAPRQKKLLQVRTELVLLVCFLQCLGRQLSGFTVSFVTFTSCKNFPIVSAINLAILF